MESDNQRPSPDTSQLAGLALCPEDFDEAVQALRSLERAQPEVAATTVLRVLQQECGDVYYRATAFDVLYAAAPALATDRIHSIAALAEPYLLGAMLDTVTDEAAHPTLHVLAARAAAALHAELAQRQASELTAIHDQLMRFRAAFAPRYPHRPPRSP